MPYDPYEAPSGYNPRKPSEREGLSDWNVEGGRLSSITEPQPTLKNPGRYWVQDEENVWREVDPSEPRLSDIMRPDTRDQILGGEAPAQIWEMPEEMRRHIADIVGRHLHGRQIAPPPQ